VGLCLYLAYLEVDSNDKEETTAIYLTEDISLPRGTYFPHFLPIVSLKIISTLRLRALIRGPSDCVLTLLRIICLMPANRHGRLRELGLAVAEKLHKPFWRNLNLKAKLFNQTQYLPRY